MKKVLICIIVVLGVALYAGWNQLETVTKKYEIAAANMKNYDLELSSQKKKNAAYQLTVDQLKYFNDSILVKLNDYKEELKIKDKNIKALQYLASGFTRTDTIVLNDTIFKEPSFALDTIIMDEWYKVSVGLRYPSTIAVTPEFKSEKIIAVSIRKETINPPKKFFIAKWFQKKHKVLTVDVKENNPYAINESSKYVEIIK